MAMATTTREYTARTFSHLKGLKGISDAQLEEHFKLYQGYVNNTNTLNQKVEDTMIATRQIRHEVLHELDVAKKSKTIGEDEAARLEKQIDNLLAGQKNEIDKQTAVKEKEIMTV